MPSPLADRPIAEAEPALTAGPSAGPRPLVTALAGCLVSFLALALAVAGGATRAIDHGVLAWMAARRTAILTDVASDLTLLGSSGPLALATGLIAVGLWSRGWRAASVQTAVAGATAGLVTHLTKALIARPRPPLADHLLAASGFSFPSGHTAGIAALLTTTALLAITATTSPRRRVVLASVHAALVLAVGWTRVYLGVHHATDVVAGLCVGVACALAAHALVRMPALAAALASPAWRRENAARGG